MANTKMGRGSNWSSEENRVLLVTWARAGVFWRQRPRRQSLYDVVELPHSGTIE